MIGGVFLINNDVEEIFDDDVVQPPSTNRGAGRTTETSLTPAVTGLASLRKKFLAMSRF